MAVEAASRTRAAGLELGRLVAYGAAVASAAAGVIHLDAVGDHTEHPHIAAFFLLAAAVQVAWAGAIATGRSRRLIVAGILGNLGIAGVWLLSRTIGLPGVPEAAHVEPVGLKDAIATALALAGVMAGALFVLLPPAARAAVVAAGQRALAASTAAVFLLAAPALAATHGHGDDHGTATAAHTHGATEVAGVTHAHDDAAAGHTGEHGPGATTAAAAGHGHEAGTGTASGHAGTAHAHADSTAPSASAHQHAAAPEPSSDAPPNEASALPAPKGRVSTVRYPLMLPPSWMGGETHVSVVVPTLPPACGDCYLTSMRPDLTFADGSSANLDRGLMLHHAVLIQPQRPDATCGREGVGFMGERFFAAGNERTPGNLPPGYGYSVDGGPWVGIFEIMNHSDQFQMVFFDLTTTSVPRSDTSIKPVVPVWLDVDNCNDSQFAIGAGRTLTTWDWKANLTGRVVSAGGHVHDGGTNITFHNLTNGQEYCNSVAGYGTKPAYMGAVESMTTCTWDRLGWVRAGDTLRLSTYYDSPEPHDDVMGIVLAFVYPTSDLTGGSPPPASERHETGTSPPPAHGGGHAH